MDKELQKTILAHILGVGGVAAMIYIAFFWQGGELVGREHSEVSKV